MPWQAQKLDEMLQKRGTAIDRVLNFMVPDSVLVRAACALVLLKGRQAFACLVTGRWVQLLSFCTSPAGASTLRTAAPRACCCVLHHILVRHQNHAGNAAESGCMFQSLHAIKGCKVLQRVR